MNDKLTWTFNPWHANWRRPLLALAICIVVAVLAGFEFNRPHASPRPPAATGVPAADDAAEAVETPDRPGQEFKDARENVPWKVMWFWWSTAAFLCLFSMTGAIYLPVQYTLDGKGVAVRFIGVRRFRKWGEYRNYYTHKQGVHLTTMPAPSRLDPFRGHFLQFSTGKDGGGSNRDAVLAFIAAHIEKPSAQKQPSNQD